MIFQSHYLDRLNDLTSSLQRFKKAFHHSKEAITHLFFAFRLLFSWTFRIFFCGGWKRDFLNTASHRVILAVKKQDPSRLYFWIDYLLSRKLNRALHGQLKVSDRVFMATKEDIVDRNDFDRTQWKWIRREKEFWGGNDLPTTFIIEKLYRDVAEIVSLNGVRFLCPRRGLYPAE